MQVIIKWTARRSGENLVIEGELDNGESIKVTGVKEIDRTDLNRPALIKAGDGTEYALG